MLNFESGAIGMKKFHFIEYGPLEDGNYESDARNYRKIINWSFFMYSWGKMLQENIYIYPVYVFYL